jgi:RNA polymerase sigma-70 factor (ECF subfamily)
LLRDSELIKRAQKGHNQEFGEIVARYRAAVYSISYRILGTREEAQDAAQDAFVCAIEGIHTFDAERDFWPWMRRIAINCCLNRLPRERAAEDIESLVEERQAFVDSVREEVFARCEGQRLLDVLAELPAMDRTVVVMKYQADMTSVEIAEYLGVSAGSVRVRLHRALKALSQRLAVTADEM